MDFGLFARILLVYYLLAVSTAFFPKLTNLKCNEFDPTFAVFKECLLKLRKRNTVDMNVYVKLFKIPVNNITVD